jgi:hypothetical protein
MYSGLIAALFLAVLLTLISVAIFGKRGPWGAAWTFFLFLFLMLWAVSIFIRSVGPVYWGVAWLPILLVGITLSLLLSGLVPTANDFRDDSIRDKNTSKIKHINEVDPPRSGRIGVGFWILIFVLIGVIMTGMLNPQFAL